MTTLFFILFGVGAGFVILTLVLGQVFAGGGFEFDSGGASPFRLVFVALFITVFGGLGLIFYPVVGPWFAVLIAGLGGLAFTYFIIRFALMPLMKRQSTTTHETQLMVGKAAKVTEAIAQDGFGKITYTINDKIVSGPAKSDNGAAIERGSEVDIVYIERNTYHVRKKEKIELKPN